MHKREFTIAVLGLAVAAIALIPAFGQWLYPRESIPVVATPNIFLPPATGSIQVVDSGVTAGSTTAEATLAPLSPTVTPTSTVLTSDGLSPISLIAAECQVARYSSIEVPISPTVASYENDPQLRQSVRYVKELVVVALEVLTHALNQKESLCLREIYAPHFAVAIEGQIASQIESEREAKKTFGSAIDWEASRLQDFTLIGSDRIEADLCSSQSRVEYDKANSKTDTYPAQVLGARFTFEREDDNRYYVTSIEELDPSTACQY